MKPIVVNIMKVSLIFHLQDAVNNTPTCALYLAVDFIQSWLEIFGIDMSISGHQNQVKLSIFNCLLFLLQQNMFLNRIRRLIVFY